MPLFDIPSRAGKDKDKELAQKSKTKSISKLNVLDKIGAVRLSVDNVLGKFKDTYISIRDEKELEHYIDQCIYNDIISIDTETMGLDFYDEIVGISIYTPNMKAAYIPINHRNYVTREKTDLQISYEVLTKQFNRLKDTKVIMFNANYDLSILKHNLDINLTCYFDCSLASRVLNENEDDEGDGANLKALHKKYVLKGKEDEFRFDKFFSGITFDLVPIDVAYLYAAHDAIITYELYEFQYPFLSLDQEREDRVAMANVFWNIEMPNVQVVVDMEDIGVAVDLKYHKELKEKYEPMLKESFNEYVKEVSKFQDKIDEYIRINPRANLDNPINPGSPKQLSILLYDIIGVQPVDDKKPRGTSKAILKALDLPITKKILDFRGFSKLYKAFIENIPEYIKRDGRVHCEFNQYGAKTGRFSCSNPNLQQIPSKNKDIRPMFVASEGYVLMSSDYSQQEPKVMTQMCGDEKMIQAYRQGRDLYSAIASVAFEVSYEECLEHNIDGTTNKIGKERRDAAKSIFLGVLYGRGVPSIAKQLNCSVEKAQKIKDAVIKNFPAIEKFEKDTKNMARQLGYVTTLWGRKRRLPAMQLPRYEFVPTKNYANTNIDVLDFDNENTTPIIPQEKINYYLSKLNKCVWSKRKDIFKEANMEGIWIKDNGQDIAKAERECVNSRIQGSAADMSKLAMIKVANDRQLSDWGFRLLLPIHDELIGECPKENAKVCSERFADLMAEAAYDKLEIPIKCDVEITEKWYGSEYIEEVDENE